jgi:hypothetical protein
MDELLRERVRRRAGFQCEYCRLPEHHQAGLFTLEHIIARQHEGPTSMGNLAWACLQCNSHKGTNLAGLLHEGGASALVKLFNPRRHKWIKHFRLEGAFIVGLTAIGKVTVQVLAMNGADRLRLRQELMEMGLFPVD